MPTPGTVSGVTVSSARERGAMRLRFSRRVSSLQVGIVEFFFSFLLFTANHFLGKVSASSSSPSSSSSRRGSSSQCCLCARGGATTLPRVEPGQVQRPLWRAGGASEPQEFQRIPQTSEEFAEPPPASGAGPGSLREELWISRV